MRSSGTKIAFLLCLVTSSTKAQEQQLIQTDFEKGYIKDGKRISVWQYFDQWKKPELVINYASGKVIFVSKDTSNYFLFRNSQWLVSKLDVHPVPVAGTVNFYNDVKNKIVYPEKEFKAGLEGKVVVLFDVDTLGNSINYSIFKSIGRACDSVVLQCLKSIDQKWIPAIVQGKKYQTRFAMDVEFRLDEKIAPVDREEFVPKNAKLLTSLIVVRDNRVFNFLENSAEFKGGLDALNLFLKNLKYPASARRMGTEGTAVVQFIIEPDGTITNAKILRGFDDACNKEAVRFILSMPPWKPGTQGGRPVRQSYVLPVKFNLSDAFRTR